MQTRNTATFNPIRIPLCFIAVVHFEHDIVMKPIPLPHSCAVTTRKKRKCILKCHFYTTAMIYPACICNVFLWWAGRLQLEPVHFSLCCSEWWISSIGDRLTGLPDKVVTVRWLLSEFICFKPSLHCSTCTIRLERWERSIWKPVRCAGQLPS